MPDSSKRDGSTNHNFLDANLSEHCAERSLRETTLYELAFNQQGAHLNCSESQVAASLPPSKDDDVLAEQPTISPPETSIDAITKEYSSRHSKAGITTDLYTLPGYIRPWEHPAITQDDYVDIENRPNLRVVANAAKKRQAAASRLTGDIPHHGQPTRTRGESHTAAKGQSEKRLPFETAINSERVSR